MALGLKKETADCYLFEYDKEKYKVIAESWLDLIADEKYYSQYKDVCFPAWSLHRLIEIVCNGQTLKGEISSDIIFDEVIDCIEFEIKEGYFNKEFLE